MLHESVYGTPFVRKEPRHGGVVRDVAATGKGGRRGSLLPAGEVQLLSYVSLRPLDGRGRAFFIVSRPMFATYNSSTG